MSPSSALYPLHPYAFLHRGSEDRPIHGDAFPLGIPSCTFKWTPPPCVPSPQSCISPCERMYSMVSPIKAVSVVTPPYEAQPSHSFAPVSGMGSRCDVAGSGSFSSPTGAGRIEWIRTKWGDVDHTISQALVLKRCPGRIGATPLWGRGRTLHMEQEPQRMVRQLGRLNACRVETGLHQDANRVEGANRATM